MPSDAIARASLPNGIRLVTETMPHVRSVAVGVWVETGLARSSPSRCGGISHLIEHLVFKGTATRSAEDIARAIDSVGGQMDAFTTKEHTCFYVQVLDEHLPLAVDLLTDILLHPLFDAEDIEKEKAVVLQEIKMVEDTPDDLIHDLFAERDLGAAIRSAGRSSGTRERGAGIRPGHRRSATSSDEYCPARIMIAVAGNVEHEQVVDLFGNGLRGLRPAATPRAARRRPTLATGIHIVHKPLEQVHLVLGLPGLAARRARALRAVPAERRSSAGSMSSRLFQEVRERQGLVYSVHSGNAGLPGHRALLRLRGHGPGATSARW